MELEEVLKKYKKPKKPMPLTSIIRVFIREGIENFYICRKEDIDVLIEGVDRLQKENEELKIERNAYRTQVNSAFDKGFIHKDKIKKLILNKKQQIQDNNERAKKCRKTIMEEQELKRLELFVLNQNNKLLEIEIADLFDLLKEE